MAENEVKEEKKPIEMSFWFIILLVVIIIAAACVMRVNGKLADLQTRYEQLDKEYNNKKVQYDKLVEVVTDVVNKKVDGEITDKALISQLSGVVGTDAAAEPVEDLSGEQIDQLPVDEVPAE